MSYTNQTNLEAFLDRVLTENEQTILPLVLAAVDSYINDQIGTSYTSSSPTIRYYNGGSKFLNIDPAVSITKVAVVNDDETDSENYVLNEDYEARPRNQTVKTWIERRSGKFPEGTANIAVSGTFTLGNIPDDLVFVATYLAGQLFSKRNTTGLKSESIEGYSYTLAELRVDSDPIIDMTLSKYTNIPII